MMNLSADWMERWFVPHYGGHKGQPQIVYAPDLTHAFKLARTMWPTADSWECLGKVLNDL